MARHKTHNQHVPGLIPAKVEKRFLCYLRILDRCSRITAHAAWSRNLFLYGIIGTPNDMLSDLKYVDRKFCWSDEKQNNQTKKYFLKRPGLMTNEAM